MQEPKTIEYDEENAPEAIFCPICSTQLFIKNSSKNKIEYLKDPDQPNCPHLTGFGYWDNEDISQSNVHFTFYDENFKETIVNNRADFYKFAEEKMPNYRILIWPPTEDEGKEWEFHFKS